MSVELSNNRTNLSALAKELYVPLAMLYRWRREFSAKLNISFSGNGKVILSKTEQKLILPKKELRDTQPEHNISPKAIGIFSWNDGKYSGL
jgi:transposase